MLEWMKGRRVSPREPEIYSSVTSGLQELYKKHLLTLEKDCNFPQFYTPLLTYGDFAAKPMVLLIGQYSTGKTTFIQHLLERDYPGQRIGPEPTTDQFVSVMFGDHDHIIPGNAAVVDKTKPWGQLAEFGNSFLTRFQCAVVDSPLLRGLTLIDTPGVLSGNKQNERGYNFEGVIKWFAERVDLILLMFDAHKLDISDEFRRCISSLKGNDTKIRILLNKADLISPQQLMRVYGALMWSLGKVIPTPEVTRVYIGSFWDAPLKFSEYRKLFEAEASDLYTDIGALPKQAAIRKLNDFIKRCRLAKVHALILSHIKKQLPYFRKTNKIRELTKNLDTVIYPAVSREHSIPLGDFPPAELLREIIPVIDISKLPKLDTKKLQSIDDLLSRSIPTLMKLIPQEEKEAMESNPTEGLVVGAQPSPFLVTGGNSTSQALPLWAVRKYLQTAPNVDVYRSDFMQIGPDSAGLITGLQAKPDLVRISGFPSSVLHRIWNLSDVDQDGCLDLYEYSLARQFIDLKCEGLELPRTLPQFLHPASIKKTQTSPNILDDNNGINSGHVAQKLSETGAEQYARQSVRHSLATPSYDVEDEGAEKAYKSAIISTPQKSSVFLQEDNAGDGPFGNPGWQPKSMSQLLVEMESKSKGQGTVEKQTRTFIDAEKQNLPSGDISSAIEVLPKNQQFSDETPNSAANWNTSNASTTMSGIY